MNTLCWHKWPKWSSPEAKEIDHSVVIENIQHISKATIYIQARICERCGAYALRAIKLNGDRV